MVETTRTSWIRSPKCATAALTRYGVEDHAVRLLSQGKFTGVVATRTVAESVFLSQLVKSLRDQNVDLDMAAEACHKGPIPSKTSDAIRFFQPLIQNIMEEIKNKIPIEASLEQIHKLIDTEAQLAKAQQKLQQHGIQDDAAKEHFHNTSTTYTIFRTKHRSSTHRATSRRARGGCATSNQETTHCQSQTQGRQARQCQTRWTWQQS